MRRREEDPATAALIARLRAVRRRGAFTRPELLAMCRWKSPRALPLCAANTAARVARLSRAALAARDEGRRMMLLTCLRGVSVAMGSAVLTLVAPRRYGVLDIRVWQLLHGMAIMPDNAAGRGFTVDQWARYLTALRAEARRLRVPVRAVERVLFGLHRRLQVGRLYDPATRRGRPPSRFGGRRRGFRARKESQSLAQEVRR